MEFFVFGEGKPLDDGFLYKEGWLVIKDVDFVLALLKAGTCYKEEYLKEHLENCTYLLKFGQKNYLLTCGGNNEWWLIQE